MKAETRQKLLNDYRERREQAEELADKEGITQQEALDKLSGPDDFPKAETVYALDGRALWVHERSDRPGTLRVRWQSADEERADGAPKRPKHTIKGVAIRDDRGRLKKREWARAVTLAKEVYEEQTTPTEEAAAENKHFRSMREVLDYFTDPVLGKGMSDDWRIQVGTLPHDPNAANTHLAELDRYLNLEGMDPDDLSIEHARIVWRGICDARGQDGSGLRWAVQCVSTLNAAHNFAHANSKITSNGGLPKDWRKPLKADWTKRTGTSTEPDRPTYSEAEAKQLMHALPDDPDETNRLILMLGLGFRSGQVARYAKRSHLSDEGPFGKRLSFLDRKADKMVTIDLAPMQQRVLRHAMEEGFLADLETAYQAEEIDDYFLIAGGRRKGGRAQPKHADAPLHKRQVRRRLEKFEERAGVEHKNKRLHHGLRRALEALIGEFTTDDKVRDVAQGWTVGGGTRTKIYSDKEAESTLEKAAVARAAALERLSAARSVPEVLDEIAVQAGVLVQQLKDLAEEAGPDGVAAAIKGGSTWVQTMREAADALRQKEADPAAEEEAA